VDALSAPAPVRIVVHVDALLIGGAEHSTATLLRHLDRRFRVDLVVTDRSVGEFLAETREIGRLRVVPPVRARYELGNVGKQLTAIDRLRPDLVHVSRNWIWGSQMGILAGLLARGSRVVAVEHCQPLPTASRRLRLGRRVLARRLDALVAVGETTARSIESYIGLPEGFVSTIHNGVEELEARAPKELGRPPTIGALGRLAPEKGFDALPRALAQIPEARAVVLGEGPERDRLVALAAELGVADRFELAGWQADPSRWLCGFDVVAIPSRGEGSPPLAALEAMMIGVPVVATDVGSVHEAIDDDLTGILVAPGDPQALAAAIAALLPDRSRRERLAAAARREVLAEYTAAKMAERYERIYEQVLGSGPA
jgi:glycosyltransferase involved in cell wall biosynthesis